MLDFLYYIWVVMRFCLCLAFVAFVTICGATVITNVIANTIAQFLVEGFWLILCFAVFLVTLRTLLDL